MNWPATMDTCRVSPEASPSIGIAILAKAPIPGLAKTRLIPHLGAEGAAELQRRLLRRTLQTALAAELGPVTLWCAPEVDHPEFIALANDARIVLRRQIAGDLGARMLQAVGESASPCGTLVIGTDCPVLDVTHLRRAAEALAAFPAVLTPAEDGGYVMIGLRTAQPEIFARIEWSTAQVMAQTRARLHSAGMRWKEFSPLWDVDRKEDLLRLQACLPGFGELRYRRQDNETVASAHDESCMKEADDQRVDAG